MGKLNRSNIKTKAWTKLHKIFNLKFVFLYTLQYITISEDPKLI